MTNTESGSTSFLNKLILRFTFLYLVCYIYPYGFEYFQKLKPDDISFWEGISVWFGESFIGWEMNEERLMKGFDSMYDYSRFVLIALLSAIGTAIWMVIDFRIRSDYNSKLKILTRTILRYHVGLTLIIYGLAKVLMLQFGEMDLMGLERPTGQNNGMGFLWSFMSYSKFYTMTTGWIELIGGVCLLFRRTTFIGSFILFISMVTVVIIDIGYDVRVKMFAIHLLLMTILLMSSDFNRLINFFFLNKSTEPSIEYPLFPDGIYKKIGYFLKSALLLYFLYSSFFIYKDRIANQRDNRFTTMTRFHEVETHIINGDTIAKTDEKRWNSIAINGSSYRPEHLQITGRSPYPKYYSFTADTIQKTIDFEALSGLSNDVYKLNYKELSFGEFIFEGTSAEGDSIWIKTNSKRLEDYPLMTKKFRWITDLK